MLTVPERIARRVLNAQGLRSRFLSTRVGRMHVLDSAGTGSLPPIVMLLVYLSTPEYISLLWTHPTGQLMLVGCVIWMSMGIFVMKRMINFDF